MIRKIDRKKKGEIQWDQMMYLLIFLALIGLSLAFYYRVNIISWIKTFTPEFESYEEDEYVGLQDEGDGISRYNDKVCAERTVAVIYEDKIYFCDEEKYCSYPIETKFIIDGSEIMLDRYGNDLHIGIINRNNVLIDNDFLDLDSWVYQSQRFSSEKSFNLRDFAKLHSAFLDQELLCKTVADKETETDLINQLSWPEEEGIEIIELPNSKLRLTTVKRGWPLSWFADDKKTYSIDLSDYVETYKLFLYAEDGFVSIKIDTKDEMDFGRIYPDDSIWLENEIIHDTTRILSWRNIQWIKRNLQGSSSDRASFAFETNLRIDYNQLKLFLGT
ncbi:MAG: hypothetical protein ABIB47_02225 [Candidatus Woesearchaeota archaeon]